MSPSVAPVRLTPHNIIFGLLVYPWTALMCVGLLWVMVLPDKLARKVIVNSYKRGIDWLERHVLGIRYVVRGLENLPAEPALIAMKHQSQWETLKLALIFRDPTIVLKIELLSIPIWGWYARKMGCIAIDRSKRAQAIPGMVASAREKIAEKRDIVIFPQGTRVPVGEKRPYKPGIKYLYSGLNYPVVPVAINSGCYMNKHGFMRQKGVIDVTILPAIPAGQDADQMMVQLETILETESDRLADQALSS